MFLSSGVPDASRPLKELLCEPRWRSWRRMPSERDVITTSSLLSETGSAVTWATSCDRRLSTLASCCSRTTISVVPAFGRDAWRPALVLTSFALSSGRGMTTHLIISRTMSSFSSCTAAESQSTSFATVASSSSHRPRHWRDPSSASQPLKSRNPAGSTTWGAPTASENLRQALRILVDSWDGRACRPRRRRSSETTSGSILEMEGWVEDDAW